MTIKEKVSGGIGIELSGEDSWWYPKNTGIIMFNWL